MGALPKALIPAALAAIALAASTFLLVPMIMVVLLIQRLWRVQHALANIEIREG
jgi:hypothetical protein